jgi:hypothetical protein
MAQLILANRRTERLYPNLAHLCRLRGAQSRQVSEVPGTFQSNGRHSCFNPQQSRLAALNLRILAVEDGHHDVVMPDAIDKRRLALSSLDDKPAFLIRADGPQIVVHHSHGDSMQLENIECIPQGQSNSFAAEALSELSAVVDPDLLNWPAYRSNQGDRA